MRIYRALNEYDSKSLKSNGDIEARNSNLRSDYFDFVVKHIKSGSKGNDPDDCWISACKDFFMCEREYAVPQRGGYCTAKVRKEIAVIDIPNDTYPVSEENYTIFFSQKGVINNTVLNGYPKVVSKYYKNSKRTYRYINGEKITYDLVKKQVDSFSSTLKNNPPVYGVLDCSMQTSQNVQLIQELPLVKWAERYNGVIDKKHFGVLKGVVNGITEGIAKDSKEVLCLYRIPGNFVKMILSPLLQDLLYVAGPGFYATLLDDLMQQNVIISEDTSKGTIIVSDKNKIIGTIPQVDFALLNVPLYWSLRKVKNSGGSIEEIYDQLVTEKEKLLLQILSLLYPGRNFNGHIPEANYDAVIIIDADVGSVDGSHTLRDKQLNDLVAIKYKGMVYTHLGEPDITDEIIEDLKEAGALVTS